ARRRCAAAGRRVQRGRDPRMSSVRAWGSGRRASGQPAYDEHAESEAADVGEERDTATLLGLVDGEPARPELEQEPEPEEEDGRELVHEEERPDEHAGAGEE